MVAHKNCIFVKLKIILSATVFLFSVEPFHTNYILSANDSTAP